MGNQQKKEEKKMAGKYLTPKADLTFKQVLSVRLLDSQRKK
jgi:hypothetical protein